MTNVEEIKSKLNIVEVIQEYVPLKQSGANFKGLCPFHNEKTPSFFVSQDKQFFKCFGCGEGGDIFTFIQKIEKVEFPEALKILANKAGVELKQQNFNPQFQNLKTRLYELHEIAVDFYQEYFFNSVAAKSAREYLINQRKLNKDIIDKFQIGYAPDSWEAVGKFLKTKGFSDKEILQSGLVVEKNNYNSPTNYYDRFRDRIMFPIADQHGNIVGFTARTMSTDPHFSGGKYINTPQTIIYNKSQILFGLDKAKQAIRESGQTNDQESFVILVEGNMDVVASHLAGVENVVASSGTALTADQINLLKRYTNNLVMCFDSDSAGVIAAERGIEAAWQQEMDVKVIIFPTGIKDPDELIQKKSADAWREVISKKINFMDYFFQINLSEKDLSQIEAKRTAAKKLLPWVAKLFDPIARDFYLKKLATTLDVEENSLREALQQNMNVIGSKNQNSNLNHRAETDEVKVVDKKINKQQIISERILALALHQEEYLAELVSKITPVLVENSWQEFYKILFSYYNLKRKLDLAEFKSELEAKNKSLVFLFDTLNLLAENEFGQMSRNELNREFDLAVNFLKRENVSARLKKIQTQIKLAEQRNEAKEVEELLKEFSLLSKELANL